MNPVQTFAAEHYDEARAQRAGQKNAPATGGHQREGENQNTKENQIVPQSTDTTEEVERWRMPSGRIAKINLSDPPEAVKGARELLAMNGATLVTDDVDEQKDRKRTLKRRRKHARPESVAATTKLGVAEVTKMVDFTAAVLPLEADWADQNLCGLDVLVRMSRNKAEVWTDAEGRWWRRTGTITMLPSKDGVSRFTIWMLRGANLDDLQWAQRRIADAMNGKFLRFGWEAYTSPDGREGYMYCFSRPYSDPFAHHDPSPEVVACTDQRCTKTWHYKDSIYHVADSIANGEIEIEVKRFEPTDDGYTINVCGDERLASSQVPSLISDLQWASTACDIVNSTPVDPVVKGMSDGRGYWERRRALEHREVSA